MNTDAKGHTPGPWVVNDNGWLGSTKVPRIAAADGTPVVALTDDGACGDPECCGPATYEITIDNDADALLIAAAPDLLEALRDLLGFFDRTAWHDCDATRKARAAMFKAQPKL